MEDRTMAKELLPDALGLRIAPLIPPEAPKPKDGRAPYLGPGRLGLRRGTGPGGAKNGQEPNGPRQTGHEAPSCGRRPRHTARGPRERRQRPRLQDDARHRRRHRAHPSKSRGRPRRRPHKLHADKGYEYRHLRLALRKRRIIPRIARCGIEPKNRLGRYRWVVERTLSRLNRFRRLKIRYEHRADIHLAFLQLGCALISLGFFS
jgi:hypothetical protein